MKKLFTILLILPIIGMAQSVEHAARLKKQQAYMDSINAKSEREYKENIVKKYGKKLGTIIANGKVQIGFSKKMCEDACGSPDNFRKDGNVESWSYKKTLKYLTFKNDKLVKITEL